MLYPSCKIIDLKLSKYSYLRLVSCSLSIGIIIGDWSPPKSGIWGVKETVIGVKPKVSSFDRPAIGRRQNSKAVKNVQISLKVSLVINK